MVNVRFPFAAPSSTEEELCTLPGPNNTALRVLIDARNSGYARLQEMAHSPGIGWYVQRSVIIPREALSLLATQLRKADCLLPKVAPTPSSDEPIPFIRLAAPSDEPPLPELRHA